MAPEPLYQPVEGKTFTLIGESDSTREYYRLIASLADELLARYESDTGPHNIAL